MTNSIQNELHNTTAFNCGTFYSVHDSVNRHVWAYLSEESVTMAQRLVTIKTRSNDTLYGGLVKT